MDFHVLRAGGDAHVMTTNRGQDDESPLQLISNKQLEHYVALERALLVFMETVSPLLTASPTQQAADTAVTKITQAI